MRSRICARRGHFVPWILLLASGCASAVRPVAEDLMPLSATGWSAWNDAQRAWTQVQVEGWGGEERAAALEEVYSLLRQAQENSPESPLLHTKMAEVLLEAGTDNDGVAEQHLVRAVEAEPDWAPAWYLAAWLVLRRDAAPPDLDQARAYIAGFETAMDRLMTWNPAPHDEGAAIEPEPPPSFYSEALPESARQPEFLRQIGAYLAWRKTNHLLVHAKRNEEVLDQASRGWDRALKARAKFLNLLIEAAELEHVPGASSPPARLQELAFVLKEEVAPLDDGLYQAQQLRAEILHALGFHVEASDVIQGLVDRGGPMLVNDPDLLYLAVQIHADWLIDEIRARGGAGRFGADEDLLRLDALLANTDPAQPLGYLVRLIGTRGDPARGVPEVAGIAPMHAGAFGKRIAVLLEILHHVVRSDDDPQVYAAIARATEDLLAAAAENFPAHGAEIAALRERLESIQAERRTHRATSAIDAANPRARAPIARIP